MMRSLGSLAAAVPADDLAACESDAASLSSLLRSATYSPFMRAQNARSFS